PDVVLHLPHQPADRRERADRGGPYPAPRSLLMRYAYTPEQVAWRDEVRAFVRRHVTPALAAEMRQTGNEGDGPLARGFHKRLFGDHWVINGQKMWNTGAHTATHNWVAVRTEPEAPKHRGISMMIVPMDAPGITVQPLWTWSGIRTNAVFLEDVRVPKDHLVGERGMGFYYAMMALDFERIMIGSVGLLLRLL